MQHKSKKRVKRRCTCENLGCAAFSEELDGLNPGRGSCVDLPHEAKISRSEHGRRISFHRQRYSIHIGTSTQYAAGRGTAGFSANDEGMTQRLFISKSHYPLQVFALADYGPINRLAVNLDLGRQSGYTDIYRWPNSSSESSVFPSLPNRTITHMEEVVRSLRTRLRLNIPARIVAPLSSTAAIHFPSPASSASFSSAGPSLRPRLFLGMVKVSSENIQRFCLLCIGITLWILRILVHSYYITKVIIIAVILFSSY